MLVDEAGVELLTTAEVAKLVGFPRTSDVRSYAAREYPAGGNPFPKPDRQIDRRTPLWRKDLIEAWMARRPGPGYRTDRSSPAATH